MDFSSGNPSRSSRLPTPPRNYSDTDDEYSSCFGESVYYDFHDSVSQRRSSSPIDNQHLPPAYTLSTTRTQYHPPTPDETPTRKRPGSARNRDSVNSSPSTASISARSHSHTNRRVSISSTDSSDTAISARNSPQQGAQKRGRPKTPTPMATSPEPQGLVVIHPHGDLEILRGPTKSIINQRFFVSSRSLVAQSKRFNQYFGSTSQSDTARRFHAGRDCNPNQPIPIFIKEFNLYSATAWTVVLKLQHDQSGRIPSKLEFPILVEVAEICEKYGLHHVEKLQKQAKKWCAQYRDMINTKGFENWIMLAWAFGLEEEFNGITARLITVVEGELNDGSSSDEDVNLAPWRSPSQRHRRLKVRGDDGICVELARGIPDEVVTQILKKRYHIVRPVQDQFRKVLGELRKPKRPRCQAQAKPKRCDVMNLGLITRAVYEHKLDEDEVWNESITELTKILAEVVDTYSKLEWNCGNEKMINKNKLLGDRRDKMKTCSWAEDLIFRIEPERRINDQPSLNLGDFTSRLNLFPNL